jgi:hypothetical protein
VREKLSNTVSYCKTTVSNCRFQDKAFKVDTERASERRRSSYREYGEELRSGAAKHGRFSVARAKDGESVTDKGAGLNANWN